MADRYNLSIKIDYLSMVAEMSAQDFIEKVLLMPVEQFYIYPGKVKHMDYNTVYQCGNIRVHGLVAPHDEEIAGLGCYLILSGKGCDEFFENYSLNVFSENDSTSNTSPYEIFLNNCTYVMKEIPFHITRIDVAIDDRNEEPYFTVETIKEKCQKQEFVSSSDSYRFNESKFDETSTAKTVYIGKPKSNLSFRFYDKDKQVSQNDKIDISEIGSWKRTEMQMRDGLAHTFAMLLIENRHNLTDLTFSIMNSMLRFVDRNENESNKSRWKTSKFWQDFVGYTEPLDIKIERSASCMQDTENWLKNGGALSAVSAFEVLEENNALGDLRSISDLKKGLKFSKELSSKMVSHVRSIGRDDLISVIYDKSKSPTPILENFRKSFTAGELLS